MTTESSSSAGKIFVRIALAIIIIGTILSIILTLKLFLAGQSFR